MVNSFQNREKLIPSRILHKSVKDSDLQIQLGQTEGKTLESTVSFRAILSQYMGESYTNPSDLFLDKVTDYDSLKKAVESLENSVSMMTQIRSELESSFYNFIDLKS